MRRHPGGRPIEMPEPWASMAAKAGGAGKLAEVFRVSPRTLIRWSKGERTPVALVRLAVNDFASRRSLPKPYPEEVR